MFQKGRVRFDIGIIVFFAGIFGFEILQQFVTVQSPWQLLLFVSPLYVGVAWGGCGYVFPEFRRLEDAAKNSPSLWKLRDLMRLGWVLLFASSFSFAAGYSIPRQILGQRFFYPDAVALILQGIFVSGLSIMGVIAIVSKRMDYYGWRPRPATPWSVSKILRISSVVMILGGAIILQAFALPAIILLAAGGTIFIIVHSLGNRLSNIGKNGGLSAPVKLDTGQVSFEKRFAIAKRISERIVQNHGKKILAVCMWGPSASETDPSVHSLDLAAVTRASEKYIPD